MYYCLGMPDKSATLLQRRLGDYTQLHGDYMTITINFIKYYCVDMPDKSATLLQGRLGDYTRLH